MIKGWECDSDTLDLWLLPDGRRGAWYRGLVFPLSDNGSIDVADVGFPPADCAPLAEPGSFRGAVVHSDGGDSYLLVSGTANDLQQELARLTAAGVRVLRHGPNLSPQPADWFIRCEGRVDPSLLADTGADAGTDVAMRAPLDAPSESVLIRLRLMTEALTASEASRQRLQELLDKAKAASSHDSEEQRLLEEALAELALEREERQRAEDALRAALDQPKTAPAPRQVKVTQELEIVVATLLPRLDFMPGSLEFMATELPTRKFALERLAQVERTTTGWPPGWKRIKAHASWWECHFGTGQDDQGRIYASPAAEGPRVPVLVSHKQEQARDMRRLG